MEALILHDPDTSLKNYCESLSFEEIKKLASQSEKIYNVCRHVYNEKLMDIQREGFPQYRNLPSDIKREILRVYPEEISTNYYLDKESQKLLLADYARKVCRYYVTPDEIREYAKNNKIAYFSRNYDLHTEIYTLSIDDRLYGLQYYDEYNVILDIRQSENFMRSYYEMHIDYLSMYNIVNNRKLCQVLPNAGKQFILNEIKTRDGYDELLAYIELLMNLHVFGIRDITTSLGRTTLDDIRNKIPVMRKALYDHIENEMPNAL